MGTHRKTSKQNVTGNVRVRKRTPRLVADRLYRVEQPAHELGLRRLLARDPGNERLRVARHLRVDEQEAEALEALDLVHAAALAEAGPDVRERAAVDGDRVVDPGGVAVQDLLGDERPAVRFFGDLWGDGAPPAVRDVDVAWLAWGGGFVGWGRDCGQVDAAVEDEKRGRDADREGCGGTEAGTDGECGTAYEVEGWSAGA